MRKFFSVILLFVSTYATVAQPTVSVGKPYSAPQSDNMYYFNRGDEILSLKVNKTKIAIQKSNGTSLSLQSSKNYEIQKGQTIVKALHFGDHYYVFSSVEGDGKSTLLVQEVNFKMGEFTGPQVKLFETDAKFDEEEILPGLATGFLGPGGIYYIPVPILETIGFRFSADSSKLLIKYYKKLKGNKSADAIVGFNVYDIGLKEVWRKEIPKPYLSDKTRALDYTVDTKGHAYTAATIFTDGLDYPRNSEGKPNYFIEVQKITASTQKIETYSLNATEFFIQSLHVTIDLKENISCTGLYNKGLYIDRRNAKVKNDTNDDRHYMTCDGVFTARLVDGKFQMHTFEIPLALINQDKDQKKQRDMNKLEEQGKAEYPLLFLRKVVMLNDGGLLVIAQQQYHRFNYAYVHLSYDDESDYYHDLLVTRIASDGKLKWMKNITSHGKDENKFQFYLSNNKFFFAYLESERLAQLDAGEHPIVSLNYSSLISVCEVADDTGEVKKIQLTKTGKEKPVEVKQFSVDRLMMSGRGKFVFEGSFNAKKDEDILIQFKL